MTNSELRHKGDTSISICIELRSFPGTNKSSGIHDAEFQLEPTEDEDNANLDPEADDNVEDEPSGSSGGSMTSVVQLKQQEDFEELEGADPETDEWNVAPVDCNQSEYTDKIRELVLEMTIFLEEISNNALNSGIDWIYRQQLEYDLVLHLFYLFLSWNYLPWECTYLYDNCIYLLQYDWKY